MRRVSPFGRRDAGLDVKMTPMIDVVFLLLVFFVWTASFQVVEYALPTATTQVAGSQPLDPQTPPPPEADFDDVVIRITRRAGSLSWQLNQTEIVSLAELAARLAAIAQVKRDVPVIIHPEPQVAIGDAIDVYDAARVAGFAQVAFASDEPG